MNIKTAVCQMMVSDQLAVNLAKAAQMVAEAGDNGAQFVVLPEMFNCPYDNAYFAARAEAPGGETVQALSRMAAQSGVYLIGGSLPEVVDGKIYNTCYVFGRAGEVLGKYRKIHLFDIDVTDGVAFKESDTLTAGHQPLVVETDYGKIGVAICYDMRFPELARILALEGAQIIFLPGAFNMTTGPAHWALSIRMRAVDNQVFFVGASPARDENFSYVAYGHSMMANPWGIILVEADEREQIIYSQMNLDDVAVVRHDLPLLKHRRTDLYQLQYQLDESSKALV